MMKSKKLIIEIEDPDVLLEASGYEDYDQICEDLVDTVAEVMFAPPSMITVTVQNQEEES